MKIAMIATFFPAWSETFIRREVLALLERGHEVAMFTETDAVPGPKVEGVSGVHVFRHTINAVKDWSPDVIYGQMGYRAQQAAVQIGRALGVPYALRLWSGLDSLGFPEHCVPLYANLHKDSLCLGVIVEDEVVAKIFHERLKIRCAGWIVPNSLFVEEYGKATGIYRKRNVVLGLGRFVKKKGFIHLVRVVKMVPEAELWMVGEGELEKELWMEANEQVKFFGYISQEKVRDFIMPEIGMLCAPCVMGRGGDADSVPTTVLEAMASGVPVIASDLLSMSCYVQNGLTGLLSRPGDEFGLAERIRLLIENPDY